MLRVCRLAVASGRYYIADVRLYDIPNMYKLGRNFIPHYGLRDVLVVCVKFGGCTRQNRTTK